MSGAHALYAPSSMARTMQCPASVRLQSLYPDEPSESTIEGEAAHWAGAELIQGRPVAVGQIAPNGVALDDEMIDGAELYAATVRPDQPGLHVEQRVNMPRIHPQCWGTPDAWRNDGARGTTLFVDVWDFKYGFEYVDEYENPQLMAYAAGVIDALRFDGQQELQVTFRLHVIQPRAYGRKPVRTWEVSVGELRAYWNLMHAACAEADSAQARTRVGPECKHCTARRACDAMQRAGLSELEVAGDAEPIDLPTPAAAAELRRLRYSLDVLSARASGLEQQLMHAARTGEQVPGFHIETTAGREAWAVPLAKVLALGEIYGKDLRKAAALTPAQARAAGVTTDGFTERKSGTASLVVDTPHRMVRIFKASGTA